MVVKNENKAEVANSSKENPNDKTVLAGLLDYFSDSALSYVSVFVASIFGMYTIISLMDKSNLEVFVAYSIAYFGLFFGGLYSILNYRHYSQCAERAKTQLCLGTEFISEEAMVNDRKKMKTKIEVDQQEFACSRDKTIPFNKIFYARKYGHILQFVIIGYVIAIVLPYFAIVVFS